MSRGRAVASTRSADVVVWQADGRPLAGEGYGQRLGAAFQRLGFTVDVVDYRRTALTERQMAAPVHVLSGGETSAFSPDRATTRARSQLAELAQRAWTDDATLVGICLGAQLLARAIAPELPRSVPEQGMEAGWQPVVGEQGRTEVAELHYEQIHPDFASVPGVTVTHHNEHSPVQAFRWGPNVVGTQFHPEWSPAELRSVLRRHRGLLAERHRAPDDAVRSLQGRRSRRPCDLFETIVVGPVLRRLGSPSSSRAEPAPAAARVPAPAAAA